MKRSHGLTAALILLLSGCLQMQPATSGRDTTPPVSGLAENAAAAKTTDRCYCADADMLLSTNASSNSDLARILAFYERFLQLSTMQQIIQYQDLSNNHRQEPSVTSTYQLALVLLTPNQEFSDPDQARHLLASNKELPSVELQTLGQFLLAMANENKNLQRQLNKAEKKATGLKQQVEELRNIESIIRDRNINNSPETGL